jgi:transketolase
LIFTRQKTPAMLRDLQAFNAIARGGYVLVREQGELDVILIATGSEVGLAVAAAEQLNAQRMGVRVVSMPCAEIFLQQDADYRENVLPAQCLARVAVEAGYPDYWYRFVGLQGAVVGINRFGLSAPGEQAMAELGMTVAAVVAAAQEVGSSA